MDIFLSFRVRQEKENYRIFTNERRGATGGGGDEVGGAAATDGGRRSSVETAAAAAHAAAASSTVASMVYENPVFQRSHLEQEDRDQEIYDTSSVAAIHINGMESGGGGGRSGGFI